MLSGVLGWRDTRRILVAARSTSRTLASLVQFDVETSQFKVLDVALGPRRVSPDGKWIMCECQSAGYPRGTWFVNPVGRPDQRRAIDVEGLASRQLQLLWARTPSVPHFLDSLSIGTGEGGPILGLPYQLGAFGYDPSGTPVRLAMLEWRSLDTAIATVDSTGLLTPRRAGRVTVELSAGGWRRTSRTFSVREMPAHTVYTEDWNNGLEQAWVPYGRTRPAIVQMDDGSHAFWNGNDGTFTSGVYSKRTFSSANGVGMEVRLSTPVTLGQWQDERVGFVFGTDPSAVATWDHRTGYSPVTNGVNVGSCTAMYPGGGEGADYADRISISELGSSVKAPPDLRSGRWFTVRLQLFPDGRCGLAIDGSPAALSRPQNLKGSTGRAFIDGRSYHTHILAGHLEIFTGVRRDMDWSALLLGDRNAAADSSN